MSIYRIEADKSYEGLSVLSPGDVIETDIYTDCIPREVPTKDFKTELIKGVYPKTEGGHVAHGLLGVREQDIWFLYIPDRDIAAGQLKFAQGNVINRMGHSVEPFFMARPDKIEFDHYRIGRERVRILLPSQGDRYTGRIVVGR